MIKNTTSVLTGAADVYTSYAVSQTEEKNVRDRKDNTENKAAVYEKFTDTQEKGTYKVAKMSAEERSALVEQLKADQETRQQQLMDIAKQLITKQGTTFATSIFDAATMDEDSVWKFLASGEYTVDEAAKAQAQELISEDGYYGVKQTSERLFDFASALAGDDEETMRKMQAAIEKGYKEATKTWGKELPSICKETLEATNQLFEDYYASKSTAVDA